MRNSIVKLAHWALKKFEKKNTVEKPAAEIRPKSKAYQYKYNGGYFAHPNYPYWSDFTERVVIAFKAIREAGSNIIPQKEGYVLSRERMEAAIASEHSFDVMTKADFPYPSADPNQ